MLILNQQAKKHGLVNTHFKTLYVDFKPLYMSKKIVGYCNFKTSYVDFKPIIKSSCCFKSPFQNIIC